MTSGARRNGKERRNNPLTDASPGASYHRNVSIARPSEPSSQEDSPKKKWGLLRNIKSLSASAASIKAKDAPDESTSPPQRASGGGGDDGPVDSIGPGSGTVTPEAKPELQHSFRFSLEWMERPHKPSKDRRLYPPRLPNFAQSVLEAKRASEGEAQREADVEKEDNTETEEAETANEETTTENKEQKRLDDSQKSAPEQPPLPPIPFKPAATATATPTPSGSKYVGRALAEWTLIVLECQNFFERRQREGVASAAQVETPVLAMDAFRKH
jgi:hypothetical protein